MRVSLRQIGVILFLLILFRGCQSGVYQQPGGNERLSYSNFLNPANEYRSHPFYSVNDTLTEDEIKNQIREFRDAGFGGFYLHSRSGLITAFLGEDWWKIMQASVDAANEVGLRCMFYDEDKWPSGYAGGIVPLKSAAFRSKCLARLDKKIPLPVGAEILKTDSLYHYVLYSSQLGYDIFNGTCYVDLFNPEAVQEFIQVSYRPYAEKYRKQITTYKPAIFSDEPHVHARYFDKNTPNLGTLSYSPWLEKKFNELFGYHLRDYLDLLFEEKGNWREVRLHYYRAKALAFEESYTRRLAAFCDSNGFDYTGHYLAEDVLEKVRDRAGNTMLHYRSMQQPGMDLLGLSIDNKLITARNLSSVANQFGKQKRLSELFGISGQNMNFEDRKWLAGWHSILGINHFCPHLTLYSMKGHRKRDYPPTFSYQQPYWPYNKKIEDYLGRIAYAASVGKYNPQILVISPLESEYIKGKNDGEFTSGLLELLEKLQAAHYDYDIGDEQILKDTAFVADGCLVVGEMKYEAVILPDMISIRKSTLKLIEKLQEQGGLVFNTGRFPEFVDGQPGLSELSALRKSALSLPLENTGKALPENILPNVMLSGENSGKVWTQCRVAPGGKILEFYNSSRTDRIRFELQTEKNDKNMVLWNPATASCYSLKPARNGKISLEIEPSSVFWITTGKLSNEAVVTEEFKLSSPSTNEILLPAKWQGRRLSPNAITLDFARYSTDGGRTYSAPEPVIGIFNRLTQQNYNGPLSLEYSVHVEKIPDNCSLVAEQPEMFSGINVNGVNISFADTAFYIDKTFKSTDITKKIKTGENTFLFSLNFKAPRPLSPVPRERYGTEIESIYLTGDFAVWGHSGETTFNTQRNNTGNFQQRPVYKFSGFTIGEEQNLFGGNLTCEGYPFYAGSFELRQTFHLDSIDENKNYFVKLPNCEAIVSILEINGSVADTLAWAPFESDITNLLKPGENQIKITLVNSLRNLLGPHHHKGGELITVGPNSFTGAGGFPDGRGENNWFDIRKKDGNNAIWTDMYNHIPFGFIDNVKITTSKK